MSKFQTQRRVEFRDTDAAGIMHFSVYFTLMEEVEHEFLRHVGMSVVHHTDEGVLSWPRVSSKCDYLGPVAFEATVDASLFIERIGKKSVTYICEISSQGRDVARGSMTVVCCLVKPGELKSIEIPADILEKLKPYVAA